MIALQLPLGDALPEPTFAQQCTAALREGKTAAVSAGAKFDWPEVEAVIAAQFEAFMASVTPRSSKKGGGGRAKKRDICFETLCEICGQNWQALTSDERGRVNSSLQQIREVRPELTPADIRNAAKAYRKAFPKAEVTAKAICANWSKLQPVMANPRAAQAIPEPERWMERMREKVPGYIYLDPSSDRYDDRPWAYRPRDQQQAIAKALGAG